MAGLFRTHEGLRFAIYGIFIAFGVFRFIGSPGDDLSSSYIACHLFLAGDTAHLYDYNPTLFHIVDSPAWIETAKRVQFTGFLHPYVQTPLWGWSLQPLCKALSYSGFSTLFLMIALVSLVAMIEMTARNWAPLFLDIKPLAILLVALTVTKPYLYAMWLIQTHAIFIALAIAALVLADRRRGAAAGSLLALAATVKITPAFLLVYWLVSGRWRAALWFVGMSIGLLAVTTLVVGVAPMQAYIQSMRRVSDVLLVSFNNQSLAAWMGYGSGMAKELTNWRILELPIAIKAVSMVALLAGVAGAGWLARKNENAGAAAAIALIAMTIFSPIAWTHYAIILVPAAMILAQTGGYAGLAVAAVALLLNIEPFAMNPFHPVPGALTIVRSQLLASLLAMLALAAIALRLLPTSFDVALGRRDTPAPAE